MLSNDEWMDCDNKFLPKRRVNNKLSWKIHHMIGSFYSEKMKRTIEYESLGECLFYFFLELDESTKSYYVQPVEIPFKVLDSRGDIQSWHHVPDVLVFRYNCNPMLYQIKEKETFSEKQKIIDKRCKEYTQKNGWDYQVIYPKKLSEDILYNVQFLQGSIKKRSYYDQWIPQILYKLSYLKKTTIEELANSFSELINQLMILPIIYYLISTGKINVDLHKRISEKSKIDTANITCQLREFIKNEVC